MKKYLMTGVAALAICAAFTSCSKNEELYNPEQITANEAAQIQENYNQAFIATFGQPAPNHDWGFGSSARTRGTFSNGNEWAANDREDCMYRVPPALTSDQIAVVKKFFQTHPNLGYDDPKWTNYFIQQVYKGNPETAGTASPEKYKAADGINYIVGSNHMDHLAAIDPTQNPEFVDHNKNFNNGDCGVYTNVLNFKGTLTTVEETYPVNSGDEYRHPDKINLMTNSTTKSFGYYNSNSSVRRTEYTGLVSYKTIMKEMGAEANCLDDGWNRSFMGFDFEMMVGPNLYQDRYVKLSDIPGNAPQYIWDGENVIKWFDPIIENYQVVGYDFADGYDEFVKINGKKIQYLLNNKNLYAGDLLSASTTLTNITQSNLKVYKDYSETVKNVECLNLPLIRDAFNAGYLPTSDQAQDWVKVGGTADGYFSDWIVTLTEATKYTTTTPPPSDWDIRIIAEDLNATAQTTAAAEDGFDESDWDFNDVVFDVKFTSQTTANVKIVGAGGVLPLYVDGHEAHQALGQSGPDANGYYRIQNSGYADPFEVTGINKSNNGKDIKITVVRVSSTGDPIISELTAPNGKPAAKLGVDPKFTPCAEREDIRQRYPRFMNWVQTNFSGTWYDIEVNN